MYERLLIGCIIFFGISFIVSPFVKTPICINSDSNHEKRLTQLEVALYMKGIIPIELVKKDWSREK